MKKVAELEGAELDYWVGKALGYLVEIRPIQRSEDMHCVRLGVRSATPDTAFRPSLDWATGGPIIEQQRIHITDDYTGEWEAAWFDDHPYTNACVYFGPTPLIAAMRAFVASRFGSEVTK